MKMIERFAVITLLVMVWAAGYDSGRNDTAQAHHDRPTCHLSLKP